MYDGYDYWGGNDPDFYDAELREVMRKEESFWNIGKHLPWNWSDAKMKRWIAANKSAQEEWDAKTTKEKWLDVWFIVKFLGGVAAVLLFDYYSGIQIIYTILMFFYFILVFLCAGFGIELPLP